MAEAPTSELVESALGAISDALHMFDPLRFRAWAELGLTTAQLRVLFLTREQPGVTAGALAQRLEVTPPTISGIVDRLVKLGLIRRDDDASDRRLVRNFLTEAGANACSRLERGVEVFTRRILVEMDRGELENLVAGLAAFVKASERTASLEPHLAVVAMPGTTDK